MVPTFEDPTTGRTVTESLTCVEFVDAQARRAGSPAHPLVSPDPFEAARQRLAAVAANKEVTSNYYTCLVRQDRAEQEAAFAGLLRGLRNFVEQCSGDFFSGDFFYQ